MKRRALLAVCVVLFACGEEETVAPLIELPPLELKILRPTGDDSLIAGDSIRLSGLAEADDLGQLPQDSLWWSEGPLFLGHGRTVDHVAWVGSHTYYFHARYGAREDSLPVAISVGEPPIGHTLWVVPLDTNRVDALSMSPDGVLYALDKESQEAVAISVDGRVLWRSQLPARASSSPAIGFDGTLFYGFSYGAAGEWGGVFALRPDGTLKWVFRTHEHSPHNSAYWHVHHGVAVGSDGSVYFTTEEWTAPMYALNPDGTLKWRTPIEEDTTEAEFASGYTILLGDSLAVSLERRDSITAVDTQTGAVRWTAYAPGWTSMSGQPSPAVGADGTIYISRSPGPDGYHTLSAVSSLGAALWQKPLHISSSLSAGGPIVGASHVYLGGNKGDLLLYTLQGDLVSSRDKGWRLVVAALAANGASYVAGDDTLYAYGLNGLRYATPVPHAAETGYLSQGGPLIGPDGTVYLRASNLGVMAIRDTVGPSTDAPWPAFRGGPLRNGRRQN